MNALVTESIWLNDTGICSSKDLAELSGLSIREVEELIENGVIAPVDERSRPESFPLEYVITVRTARRLRDDFELDPHGVALALALLRRIDQLESELKALDIRRARDI